ncbi:hypothetical protein GGI07_001816 [Coemansia sp. Benny D115]|nr:hypothetical protein GGI07_001816 [Coemansia sp. Benny D115]
MAASTAAGASDDKNAGEADEQQLAAPDVEAAKRNLQALVAAGIHAQGLLDDDDDDEEEDLDEEDDDVAMGGDEELVSGRVHMGFGSDLTAAEYQYQQPAIASGDGLLSAAVSAAYDAGQTQYSVPATGFSESASASASTETTHQALLSRVASNFRALIGHGLATGAVQAVEEKALDDDEAYALARSTLASNLQCQRHLRQQLSAVDAAQRRNGALQGQIGALLTMQAKANSRRGQARRTAAGAALAADQARPTANAAVTDPVTGEARIGASMAFVDEDGSRPPDNRDAARRKKHPPIVYRARRWTDAEREALARGVRTSNRRILAQRLFTQTQDPRSVWEVDRMADDELEMNLAGLDWKHIARQFVPQHRAVECAIQWATQDHPIINRTPWSKREERRLAEVAREHNGRDWVAIAKALGTQRTAAQCFQVFQRKLNADMSRSKWTPEEDRVLTEAVMTYGEGDWQAVAACLDNRTGQQVLHRWCKSINPAIRSGRWDRDEDVALLAAVRLYGVGQWTKIAKHVPGRTDVKCRERYMNVLTPDVNNAQWTPAEDARLIAIVNRVGTGKWSYVADLLGGRTDNQCWRHWRSLHKRGAAPDPPPGVGDGDGDEDGECEEGTVPSFPEWEAEHDEAHLGFAFTQGSGRKRKTMSGIESARKRQWKRATTTGFVPLLADISPTAAAPASANEAAATKALGSASPAAAAAVAAGGRTRKGRTLQSQSQSPSPPLSAGASGRARPGLTLNIPSAATERSLDVYSPPPPSATTATGSSGRRSAGIRRGRALNWSTILHPGAERQDTAGGEESLADAHLRPVLPSVTSMAALQRLVAAIPELSDAFNAALVGVDDESQAPAMSSAPMSWLRQRVEALFVWPLMLGTLEAEDMRRA